MKKLISITCGAMIILSFFACSSKKAFNKATKSTRVEVPFKDSKYNTDKKYYRAVQTGESSNLAIAKKIALQNAKTEIVQNISSTIKAVTEQYINQRTVSDAQESANKFEENSRLVVNQELNNIKIIGEDVYRAKNGVYTYWVAIEVSKKDLEERFKNQISSSNSFKLDADKQEFMKIFNEEMQK